MAGSIFLHTLWRTNLPAILTCAVCSAYVRKGGPIKIASRIERLHAQFPWNVLSPNLKHPPRWRFLSRLQPLSQQCLLTTFRSTVQYTHSIRAVRAARLVHTNPSRGCSQRWVFLLSITALTEFVAPVTASSGNWIGHVRLALGSLPLMSCSPVERTSVPCSQLSASVKAGPCGNQPARIGSSSHREDKHHSNLYYYSTYFAL